MRNEDKSWLLIEGRNSTETGPFTFAQLERRYAANEIGGSTLCFPKTFFGATSWRPLRYYFPAFECDARPDTAPRSEHTFPAFERDARPDAAPRSEHTFESPGSPQPSMGVLILASALLAAFFMPWLQVLGAGLSGYEIGRLGSYGNYAWIVPILAGFTITVSLARQNNRLLGAITGIAPLVVLLYAVTRVAGEAGPRGFGQLLDVAGHVLSIGAYLTIICSLGLLIASMIPPQVQSSPLPPVQPPQTADKLTQLERLVRLRDQGVLSESEFETQKRQILQ